MSIIKNKSKRYQSLLKDLDQTKSYKIDEAVKIIKDRAKTKLRNFQQFRYLSNFVTGKQGRYFII